MSTVNPLLVLRARAEARALLYGAGEFDFGEATDPLFAYAAAHGLVDLVGLEAIAQIIFDAFGVALPNAQGHA